MGDGHINPSDVEGQRELADPRLRADLERDDRAGMVKCPACDGAGCGPMQVVYWASGDPNACSPDYPPCGACEEEGWVTPERAEEIRCELDREADYEAIMEARMESRLDDREEW